MNVTFDRPGWSYEILKALHMFHQQEEYCDVVVVCNDKKIRAHSCVLAAASPWVASELQCGSSEGPVQIVSLEDTPSQVVQYIMTFVYTGQFKVPLKHMKEVQALAGRLRIKCMDDDEEEGGEAEDTPQDYEVPVPDSSLPSDTVVTLNTDWNEADSTPSASQSDSKPSISHSHKPPAARHTGPSHSQGSVPTSPPIYSRPVSLKRSVQDPQSDIPGKRKRGRPKKAAATIATPPVTTETHTVQSAASRISDRAAEQSDGDSDNNSLHDNSHHDNSDVESVGGVVKEEEADDPETEDPTAVKSDDPGTANPTAVKSDAPGTKKPATVPGEKKTRKRRSVNTQYKREDGRYYCPDCDRNFSAVSSFIEHRRRHDNNFRYTCDVCDKGFMSQQSWKSHYLRHMNVDFAAFASNYGKQPPELDTDDEGEPFSLPTETARVTMGIPDAIADTDSADDDTAEPPPVYSIPMRPPVPPQHAEGTTESKGDDKTKKWFHCDLCEYKSNQLYNLERHRRMHYNDYVRCSHCPYRSLDKYGLKQHMTLKHTGDPLVCDKCSKTFTSRSGLYLHIRRVHENRPRYRCSICDKAFSSLAAHEGHMNKHRDFKPYKCLKCNTSFTYYSSHRRHEMSCHQGTRLKCDQCPSEFASEQNLKEHLAAKHSDAVVSCPCGQTFKWRKCLHRHLKTCSVLRAKAFESGE